MLNMGMVVRCAFIWLGWTLDILLCMPCVRFLLILEVLLASGARLELGRSSSFVQIPQSYFFVILISFVPPVCASQFEILDILVSI